MLPGNIFVIRPIEWKRDQALKFRATHVYPDINAGLMGILETTSGFMAKGDHHRRRTQLRRTWTATLTITQTPEPA